MKFGEELRSSMIKDYECSYLDYDGLKKLLKKAKPPKTTTTNATASSKSPKGKGRSRGNGADAPPAAAGGGESRWTDADEENFCAALTRELAMVAMKQEVQKSQLQRQMAVTRGETKEAMGRLENLRAGEEGPSEHEFDLLERDIGDLIVQVHELSKYVQLNYTGFCKIIKKHDVSWGEQLEMASPAESAHLPRRLLSREQLTADTLLETHKLASPPRL
jgi:SPX domain protein involved in polyphosphate accumulation